MSLLHVVVAGTLYFILGGIWFTPLFGKYWDSSVGFSRPPRWRPALPYYVVPFLGCLIASLAMDWLLDLTKPTSVQEVVDLGLVVGLGFSACITTINAVSPNMARPGLYAAVTGTYHVCGTLLSALVLFVLR